MQGTSQRKAITPAFVNIFEGQITKMTPHRQRVLGFFDNELSTFILPDLEILRIIRPDNMGLRACTIPQAMLLFAVLDLLGLAVQGFCL